MMTHPQHLETVWPGVAEVYDEKLVNSLNDNSGSSAFLVSGDAHHRLQVYIAVSYDCLAGHFILFHRRIIHHRNIQDAPTQQWPE
jgi:hypothetical protein